MNWIITLIIGVVLGWLASILMKTSAPMGMIANVLVGIVGSVIGFWAAGGAHPDPAGAGPLQVAATLAGTAP